MIRICEICDKDISSKNKGAVVCGTKCRNERYRNSSIANKKELLIEVTAFISYIKSKNLIVDVTDIMNISDLVYKINKKNTDKENDIDKLFKIIVDFYKLYN